MPHHEDSVTAIRSTAVYRNDQLTKMLGVSAAFLRDARFNGQLRSVYIGHKICYLGKWVLAWLQAESVMEDVYMDEKCRAVEDGKDE
jgi:hypothetical protein